jgi:hypothetical protein
MLRRESPPVTMAAVFSSSATLACRAPLVVGVSIAAVAMFCVEIGSRFAGGRVERMFRLESRKSRRMIERGLRMANLLGSSRE